MSLAPVTVESLKNNNGKRSVTLAIFPPGAECLWHEHAQYEETFEIKEGEFTVWHGTTKEVIKAGQSSGKIKLREPHRFKNESQQNVVAHIIVEPGHKGCEDVNSILAGLEKAGEFNNLNKFKGYNSLWIILYDMTNTLLTGMPRVIFTFLNFILGKNKLENVRRELLDKYLK